MPAYAYLDPVTGTFLIQGLIAGIAACLAGIRSIRERIIGFFTSIVSPSHEGMSVSYKTK